MTTRFITNTTASRAPARRPLAGALFIALLAPGLAFAGTAKEKELEARIAQLEAQVQALLNSQQQQQTQLADTKTQLDQVKAAQPAPLPAGKQPIQVTAINPAGNPGTTFSCGGFVKLDAMVTDTSDGRIADGRTASSTSPARPASRSRRRANSIRPKRVRKVGNLVK